MTNLPGMLKPKIDIDILHVPSILINKNGYWLLPLHHPYNKLYVKILAILKYLKNISCLVQNCFKTPINAFLRLNILHKRVTMPCCLATIKKCFYPHPDALKPVIFKLGQTSTVAALLLCKYTTPSFYSTFVTPLSPFSCDIISLHSILAYSDIFPQIKQSIHEALL